MLGLGFNIGPLYWAIPLTKRRQPRPRPYRHHDGRAAANATMWAVWHLTWLASWLIGLAIIAAVWPCLVVHRWRIQLGLPRAHAVTVGIAATGLWLLAASVISATGRD